MEDYKEIKDILISVLRGDKPCLMDELSEKDAADLRERILECVEKQIALKPCKIEMGDQTGRFLPFCPRCEHSQLATYFDNCPSIPAMSKYCPNCGQLVTWSEKEFENKRGITHALIYDAYINGDVRLGIDPNDDCGIVAFIGDYWFFFINSFDNTFKSVEDFKEQFEDEQIVTAIYEALRDSRNDKGFKDEYMYYFAYLSEEKQRREFKKVWHRNVE